MLTLGHESMAIWEFHEENEIGAFMGASSFRFLAHAGWTGLQQLSYPIILLR